MSQARTYTDEEILQTIKQVIADIAMTSPSEIKAEASLIDDLGMESIDFLDIVFRLEESFGISLPRKNPVQRIISVIGEDNFSQDGKVGRKGVEMLRITFPNCNAGRIYEDMPVADIPSLITVGSYVDVIKRGLEIASWRPKQCDRCGGTELTQSDKDTIDFKNDPVPLGPVFQCLHCHTTLISPSYDEVLIKQYQQVLA
jgi:acyl carrier protein